MNRKTSPGALLGALLGAWLALCAARGAGEARTPVRLAEDPALSPDGRVLYFAWAGDVWSVPAAGGEARRLTAHPARDGQPAISPDGETLAFVSERDGSPQVYTMSAGGGRPERRSWHSEGYRLEGWLPDGSGLLVSGARDHFWRHPERFLVLTLEGGEGERLLFDAYGHDGDLSADGSRLLFAREGEKWWRKGYRGSRVSQVWEWDSRDGTFRELLAPEGGARWPLWLPGTDSFLYVGACDGSFDLWRRDIASGEETRLTSFADDSVVFPAISRDGSVVVFRHRFDLWRLDPRHPGSARRIEITAAADLDTLSVVRRRVSSATEAAFSPDGLDIAVVAGGDLWVLDTELREPRQVTRTAGEESSPLFAPDGSALYFTSDVEGRVDVWKATRSDPERWWWQNDEFRLEPLTRDPEVESSLSLSPSGERLAYVRGRGDLWVRELASGQSRRLLESWNVPDYDWSPDGKWIVYALSDDDFNRDIWIAALDGSREPYNVSRHPDNEQRPRWSPDGRAIAFTGRRFDDEIDIRWVWLRKEDEERSERDRTLEKALEKVSKARKEPKPKPEPGPEPEPKPEPGPKAEPEPKPKPEPKRDPPANEDPKSPGRKEEEAPPVEVRIDFDGLSERVHRISIPRSAERDLIWSHDSKRLAFSASVDGREGTYVVEIPGKLEPRRISSRTGSPRRWIAAGDRILWLTGGVPGSLAAGGKTESWPFRALQTLDRRERFRAAFDAAWRAMRDRWYDERLGNRNWDAVRRKYREAAAGAPDLSSLSTVIHLMLGELNGSHLGFGFRGPSGASGEQWRPVTPHLGLRFDPAWKGPGLRVRDVLPRGPTDRAASRVEPGEIVVAIDGEEVDPGLDLARRFRGPLERDLTLRVRSNEGPEREVTLRPISWSAARGLLYEQWIERNRAEVARASVGRLGYVHIRGMNWSSFRRFEREIYAQGAGKEGLLIDVRENGGGFTADHLLTILAPATHALTVPRGGGPGYPHDRRVYATWKKPIVVLCNQNSFSNAEIFSHAIQTLGRGKLVGVPTAGGVISTGSVPVLDIGWVRMPFRGWFVLPTGEDMELNPAVPDAIVWPEPGDLPAGRDPQLARAVELGLEEVRAAERAPRPPLRRASERPENRPRGVGL